MAHFAELDKDNKVLRVIVVSNDETHDANGVESEELGIAFCKKLFGADTKWVQTSYNKNFRKDYAYVGGTYDEKEDAFICASPYLSWEFNKEKWVWEAPIPIPSDGKNYAWNEDTTSWVEETLAIE